MSLHLNDFDESHWLAEISHYLPAQAPLKDFVHHNTLHAFQDKPFHEAMQQATALFGYQTYAAPAYYRKALQQGQIGEAQLLKHCQKLGLTTLDAIKESLSTAEKQLQWTGCIGQVRQQWQARFHINLDKAVHPLLFRTVGSYLDQGFSTWKFPISPKGFLASLREVDRQSYYRLFKNKRVRALLRQPGLSLTRVLELTVGPSDFFGPYLTDMAFAHPGWSGMVATLQNQPESLLDSRKITLREFLLFELLLELDVLYERFGHNFRPLMADVKQEAPNYFSPLAPLAPLKVLAAWQDALEWTFYDQLLVGIQHRTAMPERNGRSFQAFFCIDDRECSFRRHLEELDPQALTLGTPGFFQIDAVFQPIDGKFTTKICPAPMQPGFLLKELPARGSKARPTSAHQHFARNSDGLLGGWIGTQTLGFVSALRLAANIFQPGESSAMVSSFRHIGADSKITVRYRGEHHHGMQVGYTEAEMADRVVRLLKSTGLVDGFSELIYVVSHGASSVNNTHYAGYDCGACSGRPGSVNARAIAEMANDPKVRELLLQEGLQLPATTRFIAALHDTTRDEIAWYDELGLSPSQQRQHDANKLIFQKALQSNARERARRFELIDIMQPAAKVHQAVSRRAMSLFEPRPELNHATNALCIVGRRSLTDHLFLDRRAFMNSYDAATDTDGHLLLGILQAATPVCGGINLEYYFSRVDPDKLGAGSKLPHNVMGLIGVANGMDGDLRPGLPSQMTEMHDPLRLLMVVERAPEELVEILGRHASTLDWYSKAWVHLIAVDPQHRTVYRFNNQSFEPYTPLASLLPSMPKSRDGLLLSRENLPIMHLTQETAR